MTSDMLVVNPAGLIGQELCDSWRADIDLCYDADGACDYEELDYRLDLIRMQQWWADKIADVLEVYASEVRRFVA